MWKSIKIPPGKKKNIVYVAPDKVWSETCIFSIINSDCMGLKIPSPLFEDHQANRENSLSGEVNAVYAFHCKSVPLLFLLTSNTVGVRLNFKWELLISF